MNPDSHKRGTNMSDETFEKFELYTAMALLPALVIAPIYFAVHLVIATIF